jgi:tetratricopeptide (TPR) repeat protein
LIPVAGLVAAAVFLSSLSRSVFPGYSASLAAAAVGVVPPSRAAHPLFSLFARQMAEFHFCILPVRLNLFSAICGVFCAMLLYHLVGRTILFAACEDAGGGGQADPGQDADGARAPWREMPAEVEAYNRHVLRLATYGGLAAAVFFSLSLPVWSAATRLDNGLFALLLALASLCLFPCGHAKLYDVRVALSVFLFTLGLFESCAFVLLLPVYAYYLFKTVLLDSADRRHTGIGIVWAGLLGAVCAVYAFRLNTNGASAFTLFHLIHVHARELWSHHVFEARSFFPRHGWLVLLLQIGLPALILLFGLPTLFKERRAATAVALALAALSVLPALLNLSVSPYEVCQPLERLPVFGSAVIAAAAAAVLSACLLLLRQGGRLEEDDLAGELEAEERETARRLRAFAAGLLAAQMLVCAISFWRSRSAMDTTQGEFADEVARAMLNEMGGRSCLVTNGLLDNHLLMQARMLGRPLTLVTLRPRPLPYETESLRRLIDTSPVFAGLNRVRLQNALAISAVRFVMEWFNTDARAAEKAMLFATPDIWTACGYRAVPEGMAFGGLRAGVRPDTAALVARNRAFAEQVAPLLAERRLSGGVVSGLRRMLQMKAGYAANELGALLEELGEWDAAYLAYQRAIKTDPRNASAAINVFELVRARKLHPEAEEALKKRMRLAVAKARVRGLRDITWLIQNYGTIRQQAFYQQQTAVWSSLGAREVAADKARKAQALSVSTGVRALTDNAATYLQAGNTAQAEACYMAAQEQDPTSRDALIGLCTLKIGQKRVQEAEAWYRKALEAGVEPLTLRYQAVMLALLKGKTDEALNLLKAATKEAPSDARYWALLADQLLARGDVQYVERQLVPDMQQALKTTDHFMIHAVRGMTLQAKGPAFYKDARLSLLNALSRNASLSDVWFALLKLDFALGKPEFTEEDARKLLGIEPDHPFANYLMGTLLLSRGALRESEDFLRRSIEKKATAAAHNDLAENLRLQKRLAEAEVSVRKALELEPGLAPAEDTLACVLCDVGRYREAEELARKNVEQYPKLMAYQLTLLRAELGLGKKAEVLKRRELLLESRYQIPADVQMRIDTL